MELSVIIPHIEALIFASDKPIAEPEIEEFLNKALAFLEDRAEPDQITDAIKAIEEKYQSEFYPFEVVKSGGGWQFLTKKEYHATVSQLYGDKFLKKLSVAAMETLSIIAYEQPVTKSEIELIRGVNCDYAVQKLLEKELIVIAGRKEDAPGKPLIYTTSKNFMDYFGINSSEELPQIQEVLNKEILEATRVLNETEHPQEPEVQSDSAPQNPEEALEDVNADEESGHVSVGKSDEVSSEAPDTDSDGAVENDSSAPEQPDENKLGD